ncbi:DUF4136 domain-containing protein [Cyclobacterium qasimii]|uniref:DUF4136 domain-containing protein n=2 Tax=Cyclobacterium qasimii TaxID=1350429 RepID=S7WYU0_9BACT|nr:DUF4136 domain-containing protein [Cyclobacterium qasimii]EPR69098.1 hypothetical protein ADICYQ_1870 [Cyclobacterium qasimii M12-11B]GEO22499.1 hypothetical protein CQA01_30330 [Cyclobacterium qasimii]
MKYIISLLLISLGVFFSACSPVRVFLEKNEVASIDAYQTFYVINQYYDKDAFESPVLEENLKHRLSEGMREMGFEQNETNPDLIVRYNTNLTDRQKEVNNMPMMSPYSRFGMYSPYMMPYGTGRSSYSVEKYDMGELVIDFIDTKQDKVVMRISAVGEITKPKQKTKNLFTSVEKILKAFAKNVVS